MAQYKLAFLGTGNMGGALVAAAANGGHGAACILSNRTPQKALALAKKLDAALPEAGRRSWRWRLIYLRAVLDVERLVGRTVQSETAVAALRELIAIYGLPKYSEELGPMHRAIRPPLYE